MKLPSQMKAALIASLLASTPLWADTLTTADAAAHIGEPATVCGQVTGMYATLRAKGQPAFLDLDGRTFTVLIWGRDQPKFGNLARYTDQHICVQGTIRDYKGKPEMILHALEEISSAP